MGHEDAFPPHRPNAGYVIGKETVAGTPGGALDATKPAITAPVYGTDLRRGSEKP